MSIEYCKYISRYRDGLKGLLEDLHNYHYSARKDKFLPYIDDIDKVIDWMESNCKIMVARCSTGEIAGFIAFNEISRQMDSFTKKTHVVVLHDLYVAEEFRRKGIGERLIGTASAYAKECGANGLELGVWAFNKSAIEFYMSQGFRFKTIDMELTFSI